MPPEKSVTAENRLLAALPPAERRRFLAGCEQVGLAFTQVLVEPGDSVRHVYFPTTGSVSLVMPIEGHAGLEVGLIGDEGMLGSSLALGVQVAALRAIVQGGGFALRMKAVPFQRELLECPALQDLMKRHVQALMWQIAQTAACTRFHTLEARLARRLLMSQDRAHSGGFHVTHEFLARMLGVRRVGVTRAATLLQDRGMIRYSRGDVTIVDRAGLEAASCGCYRACKEIYARTLGRCRRLPASRDAG
ncbi:Crp/Fnr family transcriptional regulator [Zeimonas arvi]|uniref:Crp/Fnr family transcriptional regulator n=1 Tax=Zeimonas arvi TaxID=2498847 RepID=UPI001CEDE595|nr:Crp/Fnr family transcriptional regulator [Zeimonas arvi]